MTRNISDLQPLFNEAEVITTGRPEVIDAPFGIGIRYTNGARTVYKFSVAEPLPCPFNISQCCSGLTLSFWFNWDYVVSRYYRHYINLGAGLSVYKASAQTKVVISLKWVSSHKESWYYGSQGAAGKWNLITWKLNNTHTVGYLNGFKKFTKKKKRSNSIPAYNNKLHFNARLNAGNFSVGPMHVWAGSKSPVYTWRMYQDALNVYDEN